MISIDPQAISSIHSEIPPSKPSLTRFLNRARKLIDLPGETEVLLTSDAELKSLNRIFRNKNKATDILSFPTPPEIAQNHAGDLAISLETAARQAAHYGHSLDEEIRILILHGLLHLVGLDHETDKGEMAARETELRAALKLPTSLIARATTRPMEKRSPEPSKSRHSDPEQREGKEFRHLSSARTAQKTSIKIAFKQAKKRVKP